LLDFSEKPNGKNDTKPNADLAQHGDGSNPDVRKWLDNLA
jgi:hypothetical protein